ncbi:hypothetical protein EV361DRAFT_944914 [Lentinula raphanica]|uniref:Voltage-gated hydrogen channel 1 n=1 Tax=Lentinula raphanica TaxID=153919 RepID=A0AA38PI76_9AGAR|nr:hypothetical protein F5878DRAFT_282315 [Lentinula raphanica]KAJ3976821.1 hypothetical protein EV361DRAFT_944914 [Lentinula raphanica]
MSSSEQQPLLQHDPEAAESSSSGSRSISHRERLAEWLESPYFHKIVIALITIDAAIVLTDLGYTLLSPNCTQEGPEGPEWLEILTHISLGITAFFLLEIPLALFAFGLEYYNPIGTVPHAMLHDFDAIIIVTTFILEVFLKGKQRELAGLLIVLRLWRLVKLVGGIAVGAGELEEDTAKEFAALSRELDQTKRELYNMQEENKTLRSRLENLGQSEND